MLLITGDDVSEDHFDHRIEDFVGRAGKSVVIAATNINFLCPYSSNVLLSQMLVERISSEIHESAFVDHLPVEHDLATFNAVLRVHPKVLLLNPPAQLAFRYSFLQLAPLLDIKATEAHIEGLELRLAFNNRNQRCYTLSPAL